MTGTDLTNIRRQLDLTQTGLAEKIGKSLRTIQRWEQLPSVPAYVGWALVEIQYQMALA
jgi:DNA-binding transcriptional regulator YiaG